MRILVLPILIIAAACSPKPISVERAMAQCKDRALSATKPDIHIGVGVGGGGKVSGGIGVGLSGDYLRGRDPHEVYETCVMAKSGQKPTQPLVP